MEVAVEATYGTDSSAAPRMTEESLAEIPEGEVVNAYTAEVGTKAVV